MHYTDSTSFFDSLSVIGWMGIFLWVIFIAVVLIRSDWFMDYEYRWPRVDIWDDFIYEEWHMYVFMVVRFLAMLFVIFIISRIMFML